MPFNWTKLCFSLVALLSVFHFILSSPINLCPDTSRKNKDSKKLTAYSGTHPDQKSFVDFAKEGAEHAKEGFKSMTDRTGSPKANRASL